MKAIETAIMRWTIESLPLRNPIQPSVVIEELKRLERACSRDVLALYSATGGMDDGEMDSHCWTLWSFDRAISETRDYKRPFILFADFLINSHFYCFKYEDEERSSVLIDYLNGEEPELVARSVEEFFQLLNSDPGKLDLM